MTPAARCRGAGLCPAASLGFGAEGLDFGFFGLAQFAGGVALGELGGLDLVPDTVNDFGIRKGGDVAYLGEVGDSGDDPAHDLARPGLGHVRDDPYVLWPGDL